MNVSKGCSDCKLIADGPEFFISVCHLFRLGVKLAAVDVRIVHAVFFPTGDAQFNFEEHAQSVHPLEVGLTRGDVLLDWLFAQVNHVRAEQRLACGLEMCLALVEQPIDPREQFARAVVGVQDDRYTVGFGHGVHVVSAGNGSEHRIFLIVQLQALASIECGASIGELDDDRRIQITRCLQYSVDGIRSNDIYSRKRVAVGLCVFEDFAHLFTPQYAWAKFLTHS